MEPQKRRPFTIRVERGPQCVVVRLGGSATIDQADLLNHELRGLAGEPFRRVVLDLSDMDFICSMGLGALIVAHVVSQRRKADVVLVAPQPAVREVLETTRLSMIFPIFADVASAIA